MSDGKPRPTLAELAAAAQAAGGPWRCPRCGCRDTRVESTYDTAAGRRRRVCRNPNCGYGLIRTIEVEVR